MTSLFGVGTDGKYFIFVRFRDEKWTDEEPLEVREDGDEHLFDWHTMVVRLDGEIDENLAALAAREYSEETEQTPSIEEALARLNGASIEEAFESARSYLEQRIQLWDWDEEVDLVGVAKVVFLAASH